MRDFSNYWIAGHAIRNGIDPYNFEAFKALGNQLLGVKGHDFNFTYPPHILFLLLPLSFLPPVTALIAWNVGSAVFFWWAARPWMPKGLPSILAVLVPGALINLNYGQTGLICSALFLIAFRGSGVAAAALTMKPHFGFLVLPAMLRNRRSFWIATTTTLALIGASAAFFGYWHEFVDHAGNYQGGLLLGFAHKQWFVKGTTPAIGYGMWGWIPFALGGAYLLARNFNVWTAATATFLISPYGLHYDMAAVSLGFLIMLHSRWEGMTKTDKLAASFGFLSPALVVYSTTWMIPPILLWGLLVQTKWTEGLRLHIDLNRTSIRSVRFEPAPTIC